MLFSSYYESYNKNKHELLFQAKNKKHASKERENRQESILGFTKLVETNNIRHSKRKMFLVKRNLFQCFHASQILDSGLRFSRLFLNKQGEEIVI